MAGISLTSVFFQRLIVLPRQLIGNINRCSINRVYECTSNYATSSTNNLAEIEIMKKLLRDKFPLAKSIDVEDISGGCGEMFEVSVESSEFSGLTIVKQHTLVNEALKDQIKQMHGIIIQTTIPPESEK